MAIVIDEYGGLVDIVTQKDIVEEIFAGLYDEQEAIGSEKITYLGPKRGYRILAETPLLQVRDVLNLRLSDGESSDGKLAGGERSETFGGYITSRLGHIPKRNEVVRVAEDTIVVDQTAGKRIVSLVASAQNYGAMNIDIRNVARALIKG